MIHKRRVSSIEVEFVTMDISGGLISFVNNTGISRKITNFTLFIFFELPKLEEDIQSIEAKVLTCMWFIYEMMAHIEKLVFRPK